MTDDSSREFKNFRERVEHYLRSSDNHREKIPFLYIDRYAGDLPGSPPEWVEDDPELFRYWRVAGTLSELYSHPLQESFGSRTRLLDHADSYRSAEVKPDHRLFRLSDQTDLSYKNWCRSMETYLRERSVRADTRRSHS